MSTRRATLDGLKAKLGGLGLTEHERDVLGELLARELGRYTERAPGRPSGPSGRTRSRVRDVQTLIDMAETLDAVLADPALDQRERDELTRWRARLPDGPGDAHWRIATKHKTDTETVRKAVAKHGDAIREDHQSIQLGADPTDRPPSRK